MKYYIIAGEASGDLHGGNLMTALKKLDSNAEFRFWGGDHMKEEGGTIVKHISELAFMGFAEVVANLRTIMGNIKLCKNDLLDYSPDALILIDYPGFNMRIAEFAKQNGIQVHYYISPQVWAWKQNRVHKLKKICDEMYCILPFEKEFYKGFEMDVHYVGHPLLDAILKFKEVAKSPGDFRKEFKLDERPILALLPGSRQQEIKIKLPIMLQAAKAFSNHRCVIAGAPTIKKSFYDTISKGKADVIENRTYDLLNNSHMAMVTSGTATLETALFNVPQVVCYKGSAISYQIAKRLVKVDYISLVNLIMDQQLVTELIQGELTPLNIIQDLKRFESDGPERSRLLESYAELGKKLGGGGASDKTASLLINNIEKNL